MSKMQNCIYVRPLERFTCFYLWPTLTFVTKETLFDTSGNFSYDESSFLCLRFDSPEENYISTLSTFFDVCFPCRRSWWVKVLTNNKLTNCVKRERNQVPNDQSLPAQSVNTAGYPHGFTGSGIQGVRKIRPQQTVRSDRESLSQWRQRSSGLHLSWELCLWNLPVEKFSIELLPPWWNCIIRDHVELNKLDLDWRFCSLRK